MARADRQTNIRLPEDLKKWLLERAGENRRSLTSEVVLHLENCRKAEIEAAQKATPASAATERASMKSPSPRKTKGHSHGEG